MPYRLADIAPYPHEDELDSGDYRVTLDRCLQEFGWAEKLKLSGKLVDGRYHGIAVGCFIEGGGAGPKETARLEANDDGTVSVFIGSSAVGQGVETVFAQIAADALEVPIDRIRGVYHGSTAFVSDGYGAYHSRSVVMGGSALLDAANNFQAALREEAAKRLGCAPSDVGLVEDKVSANGSPSRCPPSPGSRAKARSSTRGTPTVMARRRRTWRSIPRPAMSSFSTISWCRTPAASSIR
jgi:carbon-monoxide dehydrogenase large subunit